MQEIDQESVLQPIKGFMQERFPALKSVDLDGTTALLESDAVDSLGVLDLVAYLEETFNIAFNDEELTPETFGSINRLAEVILAKQAER